MAYDPKATTNRDWARVHLNFGILAVVFLAVLLLARFEVIDGGFGTIGVTGTALAILVMFTTRKADEYTESLWSAGANAGFMAAVSWLLLAPFVEGVWDGLTANENRMEWPTDIGVYIAISAFLVAFNWKRLRGAM